MAIYHEARGESRRGKVAVGHVIMNRAEEKNKDVCDVIKEKSQFSFVRNGKAPKPKETEKFYESMTLASDILAEKTKDPTKGSKYFWSAKKEDPKWSSECKRRHRIGNHWFCDF